MARVDRQDRRPSSHESPHAEPFRAPKFDAKGVPSPNPTPRAFCPPAQGCRNAATVGNVRNHENNPDGVVAVFARPNPISATGPNDYAATPLGLLVFTAPRPG